MSFTYYIYIISHYILIVKLYICPNNTIILLFLMKDHILIVIHKFRYYTVTLADVFFLRISLR